MKKIYFAATAKFQFHFLTFLQAGGFFADIFGGLSPITVKRPLASFLDARIFSIVFLSSPFRSWFFQFE